MTRREAAIEAAARAAWVDSLRPADDEARTLYERVWDQSSRAEKDRKSRGFPPIVDAVLAVADEHAANDSRGIPPEPHREADA